MQKLLFISLLVCFIFTSLPAKSFSKPEKVSKEADKAYTTAVRVHKWANEKEMFNLYAKSAQLGHPIAQYNLAMMYDNGKSVTIDHQQAVYWYKKSAEQEFSTAQYRLGEMYFFAKGGLPKDVEKAIGLFRKAAAQNEAGAQLNLAILYGTGEGVVLNFGQANFWFIKAMEHGQEEASTYQNLLFAAKDKKFSETQRHFYWTKKAAELGINSAKVELAKLYKAGKAVLINDVDNS